jgi:hypothetical protein
MDRRRWTEHSAMTQPGDHAGMVAALPARPADLAAIIQGVLVHADWMAAYGLDGSTCGANGRGTLGMADRIDDILRRDARPLTSGRLPALRSTGSCRDFALMLCSALRSKGVPARLRCGFAAYFDTEWEDHWMCQYQDIEGAWHIADAQIDPMLRQRNAIGLDAMDVPAEAFLTAGEAWLACRRSAADASAFGHGVVTGWWFLKVNVLRDHLALNDREISYWDRWREAAPLFRTVADAELERLDALAQHPEQALLDIMPDWLAGARNGD